MPRKRSRNWMLIGIGLAVMVLAIVIGVGYLAATEGHDRQQSQVAGWIIGLGIVLGIALTAMGSEMKLQ